MNPSTQIVLFSVLAVASAARLAFLCLRDDAPIREGIVLTGTCLWSLILLARAISLL